MIFPELTDENINDTSVIDNNSLDTTPQNDLIDSNNNEINDDITINESEEVIEKKEECTALVEVKPNSLFVAQNMFKKSIKISIKSFLISLSLSFLNLFI